MAKHDEEQTQAHEHHEMDPSNQHIIQETKGLVYKKNKISLIALLVATTSLVITGYSLKTLHRLHHKMAHQSALFKYQAHQLKQQNLQNEQHLEQIIQDLQNAQATQNNQLIELNKKLDTAIAQGTYQNEDWLCLKARYYLELAQINHRWSENPDATMSLLQEADRLLAQIHAPKIANIRQTLAQEQAQLKAQSTPDYTGILSTLNAIQSSLNQLPLYAMQVQNTKDTVLNTKSTGSSPWRMHMQESLSQLKKLVIIKRDDELIKPLMTPELLSLVRDRIQFNLQEAQWAVLNNNASVYQLALTQAITQIKDALGSTKETDALIAQLTQLQEIKWNENKPSIDGSLMLLNELISLHDLSNTKPLDGTGAHKE